MNSLDRFSMSEEDVLRTRLEEMRRRHRDLDEAIDALHDSSGDIFTIKRLKQEKLRLKDRISWLTDRLYPDIIA